VNHTAPRVGVACAKAPEPAHLLPGGWLSKSTWLAHLPTPLHSTSTRRVCVASSECVHVASRANPSSVHWITQTSNFPACTHADAAAEKLYGFV